MKKILFILLLAISANIYAQDAIDPEETTAGGEKIEMADRFRAEGKIYVVVAIVAIVLGGLIVYAFAIDRKVTKLEKYMEEDPERNQK